MNVVCTIVLYYADVTRCLTVLRESIKTLITTKLDYNPGFVMSN